MSCTFNLNFTIMKIFLLFLLTVVAIGANAQDKSGPVIYHNLIPVEGTEFVIASEAPQFKAAEEPDQKALLFINTVTGETTRVNFQKEALLGKMEQVRLDSLGINMMLLSARTVNANNNKSIDYNDPQQLIAISPDGRKKVQITEDRFFVVSYAINKKNGVLVVTGFSDINKNGKRDAPDKGEILLYDMKGLVLVKRI